jgi:hypothetical protein
VKRNAAVELLLGLLVVFWLVVMALAGHAVIDLTLGAIGGFVIGVWVTRAVVVRPH